MALRVSPQPDDDGQPAGSTVSAGDRRGPVAALILFIALFFGAAPSAIGPSADPLSRVSPARQGRQAPARGAFEQDRGVVSAAQAEEGASVPPPPPRVVTAAVHGRPARDAARPDVLDLPRLRAASYSARAPPAA
ncbi:MAG TPA: hypothetical protein VEZ20_02800 [Allosphingosinicella sp.]|nr:hypothetical protein [Allosphingosinicella sp.]